MNVLQMPRMIFSFSEGWDDLIRIHPSIARLFAWVVFPLSLLPPAMIYYAGGSYGDVFVPGISPEQWHLAAGVFFIAQLLTVPVMAGLVHLVSRLNNAPTNYHACFTLAAIAPIPMWLSSLSLFVPSLWVGLVVGGLGLLCSVPLIYRGVVALFSMTEEIKAQQMASVIVAAGLFMWLVLMQIILKH